MSLKNHVFSFYFAGLKAKLRHANNAAYNAYNHRGGGGGGRLPQEPYFDNFIEPETGLGRRNVTTVEGGRAVLLCTVRHLGENRTVNIEFL